MRDQLITLTDSELAVGADGGAGAWLEFGPAGAPEPLYVRLTEGQLLMTIEALVMAYAELRGANPQSVARGINPTLRNRTKPRTERPRAGSNLS